jgi:hypothetical protein
VLGTCYFPPNQLQPASAFEVSFSSDHPGGCIMSTVDGSVRFVGDSIDITVWRALGSRDGGEVVGRF